jgi:hypothetical protein
VVHGRAAPALLDSYEAERIPVAERLLATTDRAFTITVSDNRVAGLLRTRALARVVALAMRLPRVRALAFRTISQIGIRYRGSPLSETLGDLPRRAPRAGDRFPWLRIRLAPGGPVEDLFARLDDTRFTLLVMGQPAPSASPGLDDLLRTVGVPTDPTNQRELARAGVPRRAFYLLRPDGHVGLAGVRPEVAAVTRYLRERMGITVARG